MDVGPNSHVVLKRGGGRHHKNPVTEELAQQLNKSKRQAERYQAQGITVEKATELNSAKLKKLLVETAKLEEQLAILRKEHVAASQVREDALRAGSVLKAEMMALSGTLPPLLSGLNEPQMQPVIEEIAHKALTNFCHAIERIV